MMPPGSAVRLPALLLTAVVFAALLQAPGRSARRAPPDEDEDPAPARTSSERHEFRFTRAVYSGYGFGYGSYRRGSWATDYPKADRQFLMGVRRLLSHLDLSGDENAVALDDPELRRFPFLYAAEVGRMSLTDTEVVGLRNYLRAGGFFVVDDFWGSDQWQQFESEMRRVLPGSRIVDLPPDHPLLTAFYDVKEILQVPNIGNAMRGQTSERDGDTPYLRGIYDEKGRLMVVINANTDLGDAWEWAERPEYPLKYSTFAYQMGVNFIVYGMSH
jgi:uncharacterized protein DUF4159